MKQNINSKKRITGYFTKIIDSSKPIQEKIEKMLADNPTFQKWLDHTDPWRRKIRASIIVNLNKARTVADAAKNELQDLRKQYKSEPKKAFISTVAKARSLARNSWKKHKGNKQAPVNMKVATDHGTKTEKHEAAS